MRRVMNDGELEKPRMEREFASLVDESFFSGLDAWRKWMNSAWLEGRYWKTGERKTEIYLVGWWEYNTVSQELQWEPCQGADY